MPAETAALAKARQQLTAAQSALNTALEAGTDTRQARQDLKAAQTRLDSLEAEANRPALIEDAQVFDSAPEAAALVNDARDVIDSLIHTLAEVQRPTPLLDTQAAHNLVTARHVLAEAEQARGDHQTRIAALQARIATLEGRRAAIAAERAAGNRDDERQGAELALIALDLEALQNLLTQAQAKGPDPLTAAAEVRATERAWRQAVETARAIAAREVARSLEQQLLAAVRETESLPFNQRLVVHSDAKHRIATRGCVW